MSKIIGCAQQGTGGENPDDIPPSGSVNWDNSGGTWTTLCDCVCEGCCCTKVLWQVAGHGYDLTFDYDYDGSIAGELYDCLSSTQEITEAYVYLDNTDENCPTGSLADYHFNVTTDGPPPYTIPNASDYDCVLVVLKYADGALATRCSARLVKNNPDCGGDVSPCCDLISSSSSGNHVTIDFTTAFTDCVDPGGAVPFADIYFDVYYGDCITGTLQGNYFTGNLPLTLAGARLEPCVCIVFYAYGSGVRYDEIGRCAFDGTDIF